MHTTDTVLAALEAAPGILIPMIREVPLAKLRRRPEPDKWSVHEHFCHLAAANPVLLDRIELMLDEAAPRIAACVPDANEEAGAFLGQDLDETIARYRTGRREVVARLRSLTPEEWSRSGVHEEYDHYNIFILARHFALHDMFHGYRIADLLLEREWADEPLSGAVG